MKPIPLRHSRIAAAALAVAGLSLLVSCGDDGGSPPAAPVAVAHASTACQAVSSDGTTVIVGSGAPNDPALPEPSSGYRTGLKAVYAKTYMVTTSNAFASASGCQTLLRGGSAADAAVSVQAVLGLTVPEATGLGSGGFMLYYDNVKKTVQTYDGRESAPAAATENYLRYIDDVTNKTTPLPNARASGRSIGTIGVPRLIEAVQKDHGKLAWSGLFTDAINLSTNGFKIGGRLADAISSNATSLKRDPEATAYFFNADGSPKTVGTLLTNPAYAQSLQLLAANGADAIMTGQIATDIIAKINVTKAVDGTHDHARQDDARRPRRVPGEGARPGLHDVSRVHGLRHGAADVGRHHRRVGARHPRELQPRAEQADVDRPRGRQADGVRRAPDHEAERLAYADRDKYVADTDFVPLPGGTW